MSLLVNSIGSNTFIALTGEVLPPQQTVLIDDRQGLDGSEKILVGKKGQPFSLVSHVDTADYASAWALLSTYQALTAADVQQLIQGGFNYDNYTPAFRVQVLRVSPLKVLKLAAAIGGLNAGLGFLIARWDLQAVPS
jgi:hypothetical protein